jgi:hypothetical protein
VRHHLGSSNEQRALRQRERELVATRRTAADVRAELRALCGIELSERERLDPFELRARLHFAPPLS